MPRAATLRDLAQTLDLSVATVSRSLNGHPHVAEPTRRRVVNAAKKAGYHPNALARALRTEETNLVGLVVPDIRSSFFASAASILQKVLEENGYRVILCISHEDETIDRDYLLSLLELRVDGIVHVPCTPGGAKFIRDAGSFTPLVELNRHSYETIFDSFTADDRDGAFELTKYLIGLDHRRIAMIAGPKAISTTRDRASGFEEACSSANLDETVVRYGDFSSQSSFETVLELMNQPLPPTAIFASSNQLVIGALRACAELRLDIPRDVSLIGFDDAEWYSLCSPPLTTYSLPLEQMGMMAAQLLVSRMTSVPLRDTAPRRATHCRLSGRFIERGSCAAPSTSEAR
jgi:LacI family transcriptional regulator